MVCRLCADLNGGACRDYRSVEVSGRVDLRSSPARSVGSQSLENGVEDCRALAGRLRWSPGWATKSAAAGQGTPTKTNTADSPGRSGRAAHPGPLAMMGSGSKMDSAKPGETVAVAVDLRSSVPAGLGRRQRSDVWSPRLTIATAEACSLACSSWNSTAIASKMSLTLVDCRQS